jgi:hypothetical protein
MPQSFDQITQVCLELMHKAHLESKINQKMQQVLNATRRECGNCGLWMTRYCRPEKERGRFKSMGSMACPDFALSSGAQRTRDRFLDELDGLTAKRGTHTERIFC